MEMNEFTIPLSRLNADNDAIRRPFRPFLNQDIQAFYHSDYHGGDEEQRNTRGTVEHIVCTLKNQFSNVHSSVLECVCADLKEILKFDLPQILRSTGKSRLTVCVIPRAKAEKSYSEDQKRFKRTVSETVDELSHFDNGTNYIIRHTDTRTTHLDKSGYGGDGDLPYPGITKNTCAISENVKGKDILLVDDLYTKGINIDEDGIQALLDNDAKSVVFYAIGKTVSRSQKFINFTK